MPRAPLKPCAWHGCPALTDRTYCEEHRKAAHKEYRQNRHDVEETRFYGSARWKKIRAMIMKRDGGLCQQCAREGKITPADMVDHIVEIKDGGCATCEENLESLCNACHAKKTARERSRREGWV